MALESLWLGVDSTPQVVGQPRVVQALMLMMAAKHRPTYMHLCQVAAYAEHLARVMRLSRYEIKLSHTAGLLHDIGKVAVADEILTKPGRLTADEARAMTGHAAAGADIIAKTCSVPDLVDAVRHHHEWFDGRGYPSGLSGREIPLVSRMIGVVDAFDTMTTPRPYRHPVTTEAALSELVRCSGSQFDPEVVAPFCEIVREAVSRGEHWAAQRRLAMALPHEVEPLALRIAASDLASN